MADKVRISNLELDLKTRARLIDEQSLYLKNKLQQKQLESDPDNINRIEEEIKKADASMRKLLDGRLLAETRLIQARNGEDV